MARIIKDRVKELSASTGTGDFSLSAAITGFRTFDSVCSVGDRFPYVIEAVSDGVPTGAWEVGEGTYSASGVITRTTVIDSSNSGSLVDFAVGDKHVYIGLTAKMGSAVREKLPANTTFYVATTGSDSNDGRTVDTPFLTIQAAIDHVSQNIDCNRYVATVQIAAGTYAENVYVRPMVGANVIHLVGNTTTPASVLISPASTSAIISTIPGVAIGISGVKISATNAHCLYCAYGLIYINGPVEFGSAGTGYHMVVDRFGLIEVSANYTISGSANYHIVCSCMGAFRMQGRTVTLTGTPAFTHFVNAQTNSLAEFYLNTFSGSATGARYYVASNSLVSVNGAGTSHLPGSTAGTTATSGVYA